MDSAVEVLKGAQKHLVQQRDEWKARAEKAEAEKIEMGRTIARLIRERNEALQENDALLAGRTRQAIGDIRFNQGVGTPIPGIGQLEYWTGTEWKQVPR